MGFTKNILNSKLAPVLVVLVLVVIVVAAAVVAYGRSKDSARTDALERLDIIATDREFRLNQFVDDQLQEIIQISRIPTIRDISDELLSREAGTAAFQAAYDTLDRFIQSASANSPELSEVLLLTDAGNVFFSTNKANEGKSGAGSDYFTQGRLGSVIQNVHPSTDTGAPTITVATPLINNRGGRLARIHRWTGMDGVRTAEGGEGVTGAMIRARIWVAGRLGGGLQALLGAPMAAYSGCGERDGGIGHGKRRSRDCAGASLRGRWVGWWVSGGRAPSGWEWNGSQSG